MEVWLQHKFLNLTVEDWGIALGIAAVSYVVITTIWRIIIRRLTKISVSTASYLDDVVVEVMRSTTWLTFALFSFLIGMHFLELSPKWVKRLDHLSFIVIGIQIAVWMSRGIAIWAQGKTVAKDGSAADNAVIATMMSYILKTFVWSVLLLSILANIGVNITAFVASLGVGGVAVALAVQNILGDLFASLSIGIDKPFVLGDFIIFGDVMGTVEKVGLKTTRIRALSGEQIICGNNEILKNVIHNYKRMAERRVVFTFGITYDTPIEKIQQVPGIVKDIFGTLPKTRLDRAHFKGFSPSSLDFEMVYFVTDSDFNLYMDIQQTFNLELMKRFRELDISFAFPTMTLDLPDAFKPSQANGGDRAEASVPGALAGRQPEGGGVPARN